MTKSETQQETDAGSTFRGAYDRDAAEAASQFREYVRLRRVAANLRNVAAGRSRPDQE